MTVTDPATTTAVATVEILDADERRVESPGNGRRGARPRPRWSLPASTRSGWITAAIAALTAVLYTWSLSSVGYANSYYTAAVKSATVSWKAFFFGSIDPGNFITVDKPPAALWVQALSGRIFGFSSWSMLLPEALAGVASVLILHRLVRKWAGDAAAHLAAVAFALTPVAVLMFRYNNPDAFLTLLCLGAAWALWSAVETGRTRMLVLSAVLMGFAFNTKMLQAFLVLPAFVLVYVVAGKPRFWRRIRQLALALVALVVSSGWWIAAVALWPASSRPYIGSTSDNSILSLLFGYNGLSRIFGGSGPSGSGGPGGAGGGGGFGGSPGLFRMFNLANGGQISWLLPLALVGLLGGLWLTRRNARTDLARAGYLLWGGWMLVCLAVFSLSSGVFHQYYSVQLAPAVAALAGAGGVALWKLGRQRLLRFLLPVAIVVTAAWAVMLLDRTPDYHPWLRTAIVAGAAIAAAGLWLGRWLRRRAIVLAAAGVAAVTLLAGPAAYALTTVQHAQTGSIVSAGPATPATGGFAGGPGGGGAAGGPGGATSTGSALIAYLEAHRGNAKYLVAAFGSQSSASIIIATGQPVITIGGFNGSDPAPTLAQFEALVRSGQVRYVLVGGNGGGFGGAGGGPNGGGGGQSISSWVTTHGKEVQLSSTNGTTTGTTTGTATGTANGGGTLYDVSGAA